MDIVELVVAFLTGGGLYKLIDLYTSAHKRKQEKNQVEFEEFEGLRNALAEFKSEAIANNKELLAIHTKYLQAQMELVHLKAEIEKIKTDE